MTATQRALFEQATGFSITSQLMVIVSIAAVIGLVWAGWLASMQLQRWQTGNISFYDLMAILTRAAVVMLLLGYLLR